MGTRQPRVAWTAALSLLLSGCVTADFREPVGDFTTAMSQANGTIGGYFIGMNAFERDLYLQQVLQDPRQEVVAIDAAGKPTGLTPTFSPAEIAARLNAVRLLSAYGERLAALAGSDAPARFQAGSKTLGTNLTSLAETFQALANAGDATAGTYIGPITTIIGAFGEMILDAQRNAALRRAVVDGAPAVNIVLDQLEVDLKSAIGPLLTTGALQRVSGSINFYNQNLRTLTLEQRRTLLAQIGDEMAAYDIAAANDPSEAVDGIRDAHAALVAYAKSKRRPEDLNALVAAINAFNRRLQPLADAAKQMRTAS